MVFSDFNGGLPVIITLSIIGGIVFCIIVWFILNKLIISKKRAKKHLRELDRNYEYLHALLTGQDAQYIQRIDVISRVNLLYSELHSNFFQRFKEIRDVQDDTVRKILIELDNLLQDGRVKEYKIFLKENLIKIQKFEDSVKSLNDDLMSIIKPEEESRQAILLLKNKFREVKSKFNSHEVELNYVNDSFKRVFEVIEKKFVEYDGYIETASYEDTNVLLPKIEETLNQLSNIIDVLPSLIDDALNKYPKMIKELEIRYKTMLNNEYPLQYLNINDHLNTMKERIDNIKIELTNLKVSGIKEKLNSISEVISFINDNLDKEEIAKGEFVQKNQMVSMNFLELEKDFIKVSNNLYKFRKIYVVDDYHLNQLQNVKDSLEKVSKDKRLLETYIHSYEKTPFTILIKRMEELDLGTKKTYETFEEFKKYQTSLKEDSEKAFTIINEIYPKLVKHESSLKDLMIDDIYNNYNPMISRCYDLIDEISSILKSIPIDVPTVNELISDLSTSFEKLDKDIKDIINYKNKATENILLINRDRMKFSDVNSLVNQAEKQYNIGDYKRAYELSNTILEKLKTK